MNQGKSLGQNSSNNQSSSGNEPKKHVNEPNKFKPFLDEVKSKNYNNPDALIASVNNIIHPEDSIIYFPKSVNLLYNKYPVYPLRLKDEMIKNFDIDTLFYMYFIQENLVTKEMARKEILNRGWLYNHSYETFFKLRGEPKYKSDDIIEGDFDAFEDKEWKYKLVNNYKFELHPKETK